MKKEEQGKTRNYQIREMIAGYGLEALMDRELMGFISAIDTKVFETYEFDSILDVRKNLEKLIC